MKAEITPLVTSAQADDIPARSAKHTLRAHWLLSDSWTVECVACALSVLALVGIAATLINYGGRPLSTWPYVISLNTVLSVLGTAMKGFLMVAIASCLGQAKWLWYSDQRRSLQDFQVFDQASRGPWGSLLLLKRLRMRHLASAGALVTLLALISDSFVQQSVSYPLRRAMQPHLTASVPYAQQFNTYDTLNETIYGYAAGSEFIPDLMMTALYDGFFATNLSRTSASLQAVCPSGDCTFPPYASLGVCSKCVDVSSLIKVDTGVPDDSLEIYAVLPNGLFAQATPYPTVANMSAGVSFNSDALSKYTKGGKLAQFSILVGGAGEVFPNMGPYDPFAVDCVFYYCARSYNSFTSSNIYHDNIVSSYHSSEWSGSGYIPNGENLATNSFEAHFPDIKTQNLTFVLGEVSGDLGSRLTKLLSGDILVNTDQMGIGYIFSSDSTMAFYYHGFTVSKVIQTIENIATSLTNAMRQLPQTTIEGTVYTTETYIAVRWLWLLLPLAMQLLAVMLLLLTLRNTNRSRIPSWRGSALATMKHGIDTSTDTQGAPDTGKRIGIIGAGDGKETVGELEDWAKEVNVSLQRRTGNVCEFGLAVA